MRPRAFSRQRLRVGPIVVTTLHDSLRIHPCVAEPLECLEVQRVVVQRT